MDKIKEIIENKIKDFELEGLVSVYKGNEKLYVSSAGYNKDSVFSFSKYDEFFINVLLLMLLETNKIDFNTKISAYLPELKYSNEISFMNILRFNTGLPDYLGYLSTLRTKTDEYINLSEEEQMNIDFNFSSLPVNYDEAIKFYNNNELTHAPGSEVDYGDATRILGERLIEVISGISFDECLNNYLFKPLNIIYETNNLPNKRYRNEYYNLKQELTYSDLSNFFGLRADDVHKIYMALKTGVLISKKTFREMTKLIDFSGINFLIGYSFAHVLSIYRESVVDFKNVDLQIVFLVHFPGYAKFENDDFLNADSEIVKHIAPLYHKLSKPKLVKLNKNNVYDIFDVKNSPKKSWFMGPTKYMIAYKIAEKNAHVYLLKDRELTVGTITLYIDKKANNYFIANILIDGKYQQMGYGKKAITLSYDIFRKAGAKRVTLFLARSNEVAFNAYKSAGFIVKSTYPRSYEMYIDL